MNLFFLDIVAKQNARYHCDKHVVKLILEATQMLYSVWHICSPNEDWRLKAPTNAMKLTHTNHPLTKWVRTNNKTYDMVSEYCHSLLTEYTHRYSKVHSSKLHMDFLTNNYPTKLPKSNDPTPIMPLCMPDKYKVIPTTQWSHVVDSYRAYYISEKLHFCTYKNVDYPHWLPPKPVVIKSIVAKTKSTPKTKKTITTSTKKTKKSIKQTTASLSPPSSPPTVSPYFNPAISSIKTRSQSKKV